MRPIDSISLVSMSNTKATLHSKIHAFPLGYSAPFAANLHDSIGRQFDYAHTSVSHRLSRFDIVHITSHHDNNSFVIKAAKQGNVLIKVSHDVKDIAVVMLCTCHCPHHVFLSLYMYVCVCMYVCMYVCALCTVKLCCNKPCL